MTIRLNQVTRRFGGRSVLDGFTLDLSRGRIHCFFGPSGCGKTTLLHVLAGILKPDEGTVEGTAGRSCSFVFQEDRLLPWLTVRENVRFVLESRMAAAEVEERTARALEQVGLLPFAEAYPDALSGGMKRRVSLARATAYGGELLLMDEPFKGLDRELKRGLMDDLIAFADQGSATVLLVTHDMEEALQLADTVYLLQGPPLALRGRFDIEVARPERRLDPDRLAFYRQEFFGP